MEREGTTELRRERAGRTNPVEEVHSSRLAALSQNIAGDSQETARGAARCPPTGRHGACALGAPRPRVSWTRLSGGGRGLLASLQGTAFFCRLWRPQREVTALEPSPGAGSPRLPSPRVSGLAEAPPFSSRPLAVPPRSSLASQVPPPRRGPPHLHGGPLGRTVRPQSRGSF